MHKSDMNAADGRPRLHIVPVGRLGNQMFQYMLALVVADLVPGLEVVGYDMPEWGLSADPGGSPPRVAPRVNQHLVPVDEIATQLNLRRIPVVVSYALGCRLDLFRPAAGYRATFVAPPDLDVPEFGDDYIVVNIRSGELFDAPHPDYRPLGLDFIDQVIAASGRQPVLTGQLADDPYSAAIRARWPTAMVVPSRGPLADFELLRRACHLAIPVSTFAWLAAWLSEAATVHMPIAGMYHPERRPDVDLLPSDDERYVFYDCGTDPWPGGDVGLSDLLEKRSCRPVDRAEVAAMRARAQEVARTGLATSARRFARACRRTRQRSIIARWTGWGADLLR